MNHKNNVILNCDLSNFNENSEEYNNGSRLLNKKRKKIKNKIKKETNGEKDVKIIIDKIHNSQDKITIDSYQKKIIQSKNLNFRKNNKTINNKNPEILKQKTKKLKKFSTKNSSMKKSPCELNFDILKENYDIKVDKKINLKERKKSHLKKHKISDPMTNNKNFYKKFNDEECEYNKANINKSSQMIRSKSYRKQKIKNSFTKNDIRDLKINQISTMNIINNDNISNDSIKEFDDKDFFECEIISQELNSICLDKNKSGYFSFYSNERNFTNESSELLNRGFILENSNFISENLNLINDNTLATSLDGIVHSGQILNTNSFFCNTLQTYEILDEEDFWDF